MRAIVLIPLLASLAASSSLGSELVASPPRVLASGLRVVEVARTSGGADALLFLPAGWSHDPPEARGAAELTAAVAVQAAAGHDVRKLREELRESSATLTAHLAADYALVRLKAPDAPRLVAALPLMAAAVREPTFPRAAMDAACASLLEDLLAAERDPARAAARAAIAAFAGPQAPASGWPDPWLVRTAAAQAVAGFHARHWTPAGSVLVVSGISSDAALTAVDAAFASWAAPAADPPDALPAPAPGAGAPPLMLVECAGCDPVVAAALPMPRAGDAVDALTSHALVHVLASRLGVGERVGPPLPATLHDVLTLPAAGSRSLDRVRHELATLASSGPTEDEILAWRTRIAAAEDAARGQDAGYDAFVAGVTAFRGLGPSPSEALAATGALRVKDAAAALRASIRFAIAGDARWLARRSAEDAVSLDAGGGSGSSGSKASRRVRTLLQQALAAQGDPKRLLSLASVEQRRQGMFHGIGTNVAVRTHEIHALPSHAYVESVMYNHRRFIANRLVNGEAWVDRSGIGTRVEQRYDKARLMERQMLLHPAFALARLSQDAWLRDAGTGDGTDVVEALHPVAGLCRLEIRRKDRALVRVTMDLAPLDASTETHDFEDFRTVDGVRIPFRDAATAAGRPLSDMTVTSVAFPDAVDPAIFVTQAAPSEESLGAPGPPDGPTTPPPEPVPAPEPGGSEP